MSHPPDGPPVPVDIWNVPAARRGTTMSPLLAHRLLATFTRPYQRLFDLTTGEQAARAAARLRCRYTAHTTATLRTDHRRVALIVVGWPLPGTDPVTLMTDGAARLKPGCSIVVVLAAAGRTVPQTLIGPARAAGLTYSRHILTVDSELLVFTDPGLHRR